MRAAVSRADVDDHRTAHPMSGPLAHDLARVIRAQAEEERALRSLRARAGAAAKDTGAANEKLGEAIDVFADSAYGNLTLAEWAKAGGRIYRYATQLIAVGELPDAEARVRQLRERVAEIEGAIAAAKRAGVPQP